MRGDDCELIKPDQHCDIQVDIHRKNSSASSNGQTILPLNQIGLQPNNLNRVPSMKIMVSVLGT